MKALVAVIALSFGLLQPVSITECPCGYFCGHKNTVESGKDAILDDCCNRGGDGVGLYHPESGAPCLHVEPQTEMTGVELAQSFPTSDQVELVRIPQVVQPSNTEDLPFASGLSPPARGRPLYLRHADLRI